MNDSNARVTHFRTGGDGAPLGDSAVSARRGDGTKVAVIAR
jgi:hypothetical protein